MGKVESHCNLSHHSTFLLSGGMSCLLVCLKPLALISVAGSRQWQGHGVLVLDCIHILIEAALLDVLILLMSSVIIQLVLSSGGLARETCEFRSHLL